MKQEKATKFPKRKTTFRWCPPKPEKDNNKPDRHATCKRTSSTPPRNTA